MKNTPNDETYSEEEAELRAAAALHRMLQTPHKPHKPHKESKRGTHKR